METIIIETEGTTLTKVKTFLKEMQIPFKTKKTKKDKEYDPEFVKKICTNNSETISQFVTNKL